MLMNISWTHECTFVLETLSTDSWIFYIIGCFFSGMISAITIATPAIKRKIMKKQNLTGSVLVRQVNQKKQDSSNIFLAFFYYLVYSSLHVLTMLLIMTYNGGVLVTMIAFMIFSYFLFGTEDLDADMPINCCANTA